MGQAVQKQSPVWDYLCIWDPTWQSIKETVVYCNGGVMWSAQIGCHRITMFNSEPMPYLVHQRLHRNACCHDQCHMWCVTLIVNYTWLRSILGYTYVGWFSVTTCETSLEYTAGNLFSNLKVQCKICPQGSVAFACVLAAAAAQLNLEHAQWLQSHDWSMADSEEAVIVHCFLLWCVWSCPS